MLHTMTSFFFADFTSSSEHGSQYTAEVSRSKASQMQRCSLLKMEIDE